ncbi:MAG: hypothetical protein V1738_01820 [Patescibacteria group bacterium]
MKNKLFNLIARVTAVATIASSFMMTAPVKGADIESASDTMSRLKISTAADHEILFYSPTGMNAASNLTVTFPAGFTIGSVVDADIDFNYAAASGTDCANATYAANGSSAESFTGQVLTVNIGTSVATNSCVQILIGTNAGGTNQITNPGTVDTYEITIGGTIDDVGGIAVPIVDDDQVNVTANVDPSMMFDLDTSISTAADTAAPYTVDFGTLDPGDSTANVSGETNVDDAGTDVNYIMVDLETNATQGAVVTIQNAYGVMGMVSTSSPTDSIVNSVSAVNADAEGYGWCVLSATETLGASFAAAGVYAGTNQCLDKTNGNDAVNLSLAPAEILAATGPIDGGRAVITGSADASVLTEAHDDYSDTLTFIATATF